MKTIKKAIFPVGGLGTRFLPATKSIPKEMLPVATKPLIQYAFEEAVEAGVEEFIFITGRNKSAINNHFDHAFELQTVLSNDEKADILAEVRDWIPKSGQIVFVPQREPKGLGHAVWCARNLIEKDEDFAVLLADEMVLNPGNGLLKQMVAAYNQVGGNIIAAGEVPNSQVSKYGIVDPAGGDGNLLKLKGMVEKPKPEDAPSNLSITGRYILNAKIFEYLDKGKESVGGEIQLTDSMLAMLAGGAPFYGLIFEGRRFDCGNRLGFLEANIAYALERDDMRDRVKVMLEKYCE
jgi:UTP--glucose-1-phosphate uridylyltransferase